MKWKISDIWLKASIVGANWAAFEIILGSFLHNLHIPFKGNILTAIGLTLMISVARKWPENGLFWRSGLICALMKSISPSAVIFGPMVAIFMEGMLLELSVRLAGRNAAGYILGSVLAMSWILLQKIFNLIIIYGFNLVRIYRDILVFAERQMNLHFDSGWVPMLILLGVYMFFGLFTAISGMIISKKIGELKTDAEDIDIPKDYLNRKDDNKFQYSLTWLILSLTGIISCLLLIGMTNIYIWFPASVALITVWLMRYKRAMRQLAKPRFWIFFAVITLLPAMLITYLRGGEHAWQNGLMIGFQMNIRAAVVILGFSVLGKEFYNPRIRKFLSRSYFRSLPLALEAAFESLPLMIANLPEPGKFFRKPVDVLRRMLLQAEKRFAELKESHYARVFIISGNISGGKSSVMVCLLSDLKKEGITVGGFIARRVTDNGTTTGYNLESVENKETVPFLSLANVSDKSDVGRFMLHHEGLLKGKQWLSDKRVSGKKVIILDEIGKLELRGDGWAGELTSLLEKDISLVIAVRTELVSQVIEKFRLNNPEIYPVSAGADLTRRLLDQHLPKRSLRQDELRGYVSET